MSRRVIAIMVGAIFVLGFGGVVVDHFFPGTGSPSSTTTPTSTLPAFLGEQGSGSTTTDNRTPAATVGRPTSGSRSQELGASLDALMDLTRLPGSAAQFSLRTDAGNTVSLESLRGKVVVISFFDSDCEDICPVLAKEIHRADDQLGSNASRVEFLTVNTDPTHTSLQPLPAAITVSGLSSLSNWQFLSGTIRTLDPIWTFFGVSISVVTASQAVSHNEVMDFIDTSGRLRFEATPFANENHNGTYSLDMTTIDRWSTGIADVIIDLLKGSMAGGHTATTPTRE